MANQKGFEDLVIEAVVSQLDAMEEGVAGQMGLGPETGRYTTQQQVDEWLFTPYPDPQERMNRALLLHMQGASPEDITDDLYPKRRRLVTTGRTRPDEQTRYAREMRRAAGEPDEPPTIDGAISLPGMAPTVVPEPAPLVQPTAPAPPSDGPPMAMPPAAPPQPMPSQGAVRPSFNPLTGMMGG